MNQPDTSPSFSRPPQSGAESSNGPIAPASLATATDQATTSTISRWIHTHDDSRLFAVLYIGLALVLSIAIGLFWLVAVVALHGLLEIVRQQRLHRWWPGVLSRVLWELKLDIGLILFAFVVTLYMDVVLGVAGLNAAVRAGTRGGARFLVWQRTIRAAALSVDDAAQVARVVARKRQRNDSDSRAPVATRRPVDPVPGEGAASRHGGWGESWSRGDWFSIVFGGVSLLLVLATPWLTGQPVGEVWQHIMAELKPFPG